MTPETVHRCTVCGTLCRDTATAENPPVCVWCRLEIIENEHREQLHTAAVELRPVAFPDPAVWGAHRRTA
jgi:hypothetical protein